MNESPSPFETAASLREENIAEYLLFLWQQEDMLRAFGMNVDRLCLAVGADEETRRWYGDLACMMVEEGVSVSGHAQVHTNVLIWLSDLHARLLRSPDEPFYTAAYYKALPYIVELRSRSHGQEKGEVENCMEALYGLLMLRAQGKQMNPETQTAMDAISHLIALLAAYYKKDQAGELKL